MNRIILVCLALFLSPGILYPKGNTGVIPDKTKLSGKITDKQTGESIPGVTIYIPDLKTGTISDKDGRYEIDNLPLSKLLVQVTFIGYKMIAVTIDLRTTTVMDFKMETAVAELNEVVVTGLSKAAEKNRTATPVSTITPIQLLQAASVNLIDAIATEPGVAQITTGSGISKPVIRGLGFNRVVTVIDGIRQEGQQWGEEHGIEVDEFSVGKVEILKGPASLTYGSDAIAGVINMISQPPAPEGKIAGSLLSNYQTNNGLFAWSLNMAGKQQGIIWDLRYSNKLAHAYKNKYDGYVFNSGFREQTFSGIVGVNKSWGYSHLHFSAYQMVPGIVEGERDSATGSFLKPVAINDSTEGSVITTDADFKSYTPFTPYQQIRHYKAVLNNSFILSNGSLKVIAGVQQNHRKEFADVLNRDEYGLYFLLNTFNYDVRYAFPEINHLDISIGVNGMFQQSLNKGTEFLIPEYRLFDAGVFVLAKKSLGKLDFSGGLRYDSRNINAENLFLDSEGREVSDSEPGGMQLFTGFSSHFTGITGSLGGTYQVTEQVYTKLNISRGFRAPSVPELSANGVHEGTINYIRGVPNLKPELSFQVDFAAGINTEHVTAEVDLFNNSIDHFIYLEKLNSVMGGDSLTDGFTTFRYTSGNANLSGGEITIDIHPHPFDWLHFENSFSYVRSIQKNQPDTLKYLPFTPAPKFTSELKATPVKLPRWLSNTYLEAGAEYYFRQDNFFAAYGTETATPGYLLLNAGVGTDFVRKKQTLFSLFIRVNNIADVAWQSHLSRLKYASVNEATGRQGVFNMGRNISFKLLIPIEISGMKKN